MGIVGTLGEAVEAKSTAGTVFGEGNWGGGGGGDSPSCGWESRCQRTSFPSQVISSERSSCAPGEG